LYKRDYVMRKSLLKMTRDKGLQKHLSALKNGLSKLKGCLTMNPIQNAWQSKKARMDVLEY
jgi:hypothetical protein